MDRKTHWESIYKTKELTDVSWYQPVPETSLRFIKNLDLKKDAKIIDVGGGDSFLPDFLLSEGFTNITVLDISEEAIKRARQRLGERAESVQWIVADASKFIPEEKYDLWHDRAAFHFLTEEAEIENYLKTLKEYTVRGGYAVIGTFSKTGPAKCSGIEIKQYSTGDLINLAAPEFAMLSCENVQHKTPLDRVQDFSFCSFIRQ